MWFYHLVLLLLFLRLLLLHLRRRPSALFSLANIAPLLRPPSSVLIAESQSRGMQAGCVPGTEFAEMQRKIAILFLSDPSALVCT